MHAWLSKRNNLAIAQFPKYNSSPCPLAAHRASSAAVQISVETDDCQYKNSASNTPTPLVCTGITSAPIPVHKQVRTYHTVRFAGDCARSSDPNVGCEDVYAPSIINFYREKNDLNKRQNKSAKDAPPNVECGNTKCRCTEH